MTVLPTRHIFVFALPLSPESQKNYTLQFLQLTRRFLFHFLLCPFVMHNSIWPTSYRVLCNIIKITQLIISLKAFSQLKFCTQTSLFSSHPLSNNLSLYTYIYLFIFFDSLTASLSVSLLHWAIPLRCPSQFATLKHCWVFGGSMQPACWFPACLPGTQEVGKEEVEAGTTGLRLPIKWNSTKCYTDEDDAMSLPYYCPHSDDVSSWPCAVGVLNGQK